ncbi:hypothetical protein [Ruegeria sp.]|uniref:hypothetical protein n=1 Tax=Ruegeria sp. TaxID=1879320 RepID=UPI003B5BB3EC
MTAWQFGCMTLCALGYARPEPWGAVPLPLPNEPSVRPLCDDLAFAVLTLAGQCQEVTWLRMNGLPPAVTTAPRWMRIGETSPWPPAPPTVKSAHGLGSARISPEAQSLLSELGVIEGAYWTATAPATLWRLQPRAWQLDVPGTSEFSEGLDRCIATIPHDLMGQIQAIGAPPDRDEIERLVQDAILKEEEWAQSVQSQGFTRPPLDENRLRARLVAGWERLKTHEVEQKFFERWRLDHGWYPKDNHLLPLFHDALASQMLKAVRQKVG